MNHSFSSKKLDLSNNETDLNGPLSSNFSQLNHDIPAKDETYLNNVIGKNSALFKNKHSKTKGDFHNNNFPLTKNLTAQCSDDSDLNTIAQLRLDGCSNGPKQKIDKLSTELTHKYLPPSNDRRELNRQQYSNGPPQRKPPTLKDKTLHQNPADSDSPSRPAPLPYLLIDRSDEHHASVHSARNRYLSNKITLHQNPEVTDSPSRAAPLPYLLIDQSDEHHASVHSTPNRHISNNINQKQKKGISNSAPNQNTASSELFSQAHKSFVSVESSDSQRMKSPRNEDCLHDSRNGNKNVNNHLAKKKVEKGQKQKNQEIDVMYLQLDGAKLQKNPG